MLFRTMHKQRWEKEGIKAAKEFVPGLCMPLPFGKVALLQPGGNTDLRFLASVH